MSDHAEMNTESEEECGDISTDFLFKEAPGAGEDGGSEEGVEGDAGATVTFTPSAATAGMATAAEDVPRSTFTHAMTSSEALSAGSKAAAAAKSRAPATRDGGGAAVLLLNLRGRRGIVVPEAVWCQGHGCDAWMFA